MLENPHGNEGHNVNTRAFPLRPAEEVGQQALQIKQYIDGEKKPLELTHDELSSLQTFEAGLNQELYPISKLNIKFQLLYLDYFLTSAGIAMLTADFPDETIPSDIQGLKQFFYAKQAFFNGKDAAKIKQKYESESLKASTAKLSKSLLPVDSTTGQLDVVAAQAPQIMSVILNTDVLRKKWENLRQLRKKIRTIEDELVTSTDSDNLRTAKKEVILMYRHRINEILMQLYGDLYLLKSKEEVVGTEGLHPDEVALTEGIKGYKNLERSLSLLDKMLRGVGEMEGEEGKASYTQVSTSTRAAATSIINALRPLVEDTKDAAMREKGIDPKKVNNKDQYITPAERKVFGDTVLAHYGLLSVVPAGPESLERSGPAEDGNWQFVTGNTGAMAVDPTKRIVRDASQNRSVDEALAVGTAHEVEGHALQAVNRQAIPLKIMDGVNADRRTVLAESGAVSNEKQMNKAMFGFDRYSTGIDSIPGLEARLQGKSYLECVDVIYESKMKHVREKYDLSQPDQKAAFMLVARKTLDSVIERAKRLFRSTDMKFIGFDRTAKYITNSQEAAYTEQEIVFDKLKALGLEKLAYLGLNLRTALALLKLGLLDLDKIKTPEFKTLELWEKGGVAPNGEIIAPVKDKYKLN